MINDLKTNHRYLSMALTCHANVETMEKAMNELGSKLRRAEEVYFDREPEQKEQRWKERLHEIRQEGADKLVWHMVSDPYLELSIIYQMALDGMESGDIGKYVNAKVKQLVEQRAIPFLNKQAD